jgi:Holliday junction resolvase RusA-like endonuclease
MTILDFFVPMDRPIAKARPRFTGRAIITPKETKDAEMAIALFARREIRKKTMPPYSPWPSFPLECPVAVHVTVATKRPKKPKYDFPVGRPDWDNYAKLVCDALNGIAYKDDSQVVKGTGDKVYAGWGKFDMPGYYITVGILGNP